MQVCTTSSEFADATRQSKQRRRRESQRPKIGTAYRRGIRCCWRFVLHHRSLPTRRVNPNHAKGGNPKDRKSVRRTAEVFVVAGGLYYIIGVCRRDASIQTTPTAGIPKTENRHGVPPRYSLLLAVYTTSSEFADATRQSKPRRRRESQKPKINAAYRRNIRCYHRLALHHRNLPTRRVNPNHANGGNPKDRKLARRTAETI